MLDFYCCEGKTLDCSGMRIFFLQSVLFSLNSPADYWLQVDGWLNYSPASIVESLARNEQAVNTTKEIYPTSQAYSTIRPSIPVQLFDGVPARI